MREAQMMYFAMLDSFVKLFLTCIPEPGGEQRQQAVARAKARYDKFLQTTGATVNGQRGKASKIVDRDEEQQETTVR